MRAKVYYLKHTYIRIYRTGADPGFLIKGGSQSNGYNYINYIIIAIIHIIILNKVHCSLLKTIGA